MSEIYSPNDGEEARVATNRLELNLVLSILFLGVAHVDGGWIDERKRKRGKRRLYARTRSRKEEENCRRIDQPFSNTDVSHAYSNYHARPVSKFRETFWRRVSCKRKCAYRLNFCARFESFSAVRTSKDMQREKMEHKCRVLCNAANSNQSLRHEEFRVASSNVSSHSTTTQSLSIVCPRRRHQEMSYKSSNYRRGGQNAAKSPSEKPNPKVQQLQEVFPTWSEDGQSTCKFLSFSAFHRFPGQT